MAITSEAFQASTTPPMPSAVQPPSLELKQLPSHLKYAYLDVEQRLPVIVLSTLPSEQEHRLIKVLREHQKAIG